VIRPQTKQAQRHKAMVSALKRGDQVVTSSGMFGKVAAVDETSVTLEVGKGVKIKFLKDKVSRMAEQPAVKTEPEEADKKK
jgi:preprotein translocase subunit YajC